MTSENFGPAVLSDAIRERESGREVMQHLTSRVRALRDADRASGPAYTIRLSRSASREDGQRHAFLDAYDQAPRGAMVVVEVVGDVGGAAMGDLVARRLKAIGVAGVILDGAVRDRAVLAEVAPPTWFTQTAVCGIVSREVRTEVGIPVRIGDLLVRPGDSVWADIDGVFAAPAAESARTLRTAAAIESHEKIIAEALSTGKSLRDALTGMRIDP